MLNNSPSWSNSLNLSSTGIWSLSEISNYVENVWKGAFQGQSIPLIIYFCPPWDICWLLIAWCWIKILVSHLLVRIVRFPTTYRLSLRPIHKTSRNVFMISDLRVVVMTSPCAEVWKSIKLPGSHTYPINSYIRSNKILNIIILLVFVDTNHATP